MADTTNAKQHTIDHQLPEKELTPSTSNSSHDGDARAVNDAPIEEAEKAEGGLDNEKDTENATSNPIKKTVSKASVNNIASVPNGGLKAWLQVLGTFFIFFNTWGILNTFGAYQTYYESGDLFKASSSTISWIGSLQSFLLLLVGALTGPVYDAGYVYHLLGAGSFLIVLGQMMLSLCHSLWATILAQALCIGVGSGCLFIPGVAILSTYFSTHLALAVGLAASGSSLGGVIYPIVFHELLPRIGFGWTTRVLGFMMLGTLAVPLAFIRVRVLPAKTRALIDLSAFREPTYNLFIAGGLVTFMGLYVPFFYIQTYAISSGITDANLGFYLLTILNAASVFGRIVPNFIADRTGPFNMIVPCCFACGILIFAFVGAHTAASVVVLAALYGFFSGTFVSLPPACFVRMTVNRGLIGTRMGQGFAVIAIGGLVGAPIGGAILRSSGWVATWCYAGAFTIAGSTLILFSRMLVAKWSLMAKT